MNLPNANDAEVPRQKISDYLLRPDHAEGASKARFFLARGFSGEDWPALARALVKQAEADVSAKIEGRFGTKYVVDGAIECPDGSQPEIRTVWMIAHGAINPRLVTAHPLG